MNMQNNEDEEIFDKGALSDDEPSSGEKTATHGKGRKGGRTLPINIKQETAGRYPGKSTTPTDFEDKAEDAARRNEIENPDRFESFKQGQWPGYLTFFGYQVFIGIVIVMLYHVLYVQYLSTISNENVKSIIKGHLKEHYGPIFKQMMEEEANEFKSSYIKPLELKITNSEEKVEDLDHATQLLQSSNKKAEENFKNLDSQQDNLKRAQADTQRALDMHATQMTKSIEEWKHSQEQLVKQNSKILGLTDENSIKLEQLKNDQLTISREHDRLKKEFTLREQEFTSLREHINITKENLIEELETAETKVKHLTSSLSAVHSQLNQTQNLTVAVGSLQSKYEEKIEPNLFNKGYFLIAFMLLFVLVLILMVSHCRLYQRFEEAEHGNRSQNKPKRFQSSVDILSQVPSKPQLQAAVCIISFDEGRQPAHQQLLDSANLPNCRAVTFVVRRHSNIPDLPKCKVYLMCTEFSERHVIIEEQGLGLGDLHRTTYDAVLKLGGQLIILYTRDPGSRRLKDNEVYNKGIYCVTHQEELVELNNLGRFFSVYDTLTTQQKTKLRQTIMDCLQ